jgi:hypothetical protein
LHQVTQQRQHDLSAIAQQCRLAYGIQQHQATSITPPFGLGLDFYNIMQSLAISIAFAACRVRSSQVRTCQPKHYQILLLIPGQRC